MLLKQENLLNQMSEYRKAKVPRSIDFSALFGALEGIRIPDLPLRRRTLYPAELQAHIRYNSNLLPFAFLQRRALIHPLRKRTLYPAELWAHGFCGRRAATGVCPHVRVQGSSQFTASPPVCQAQGALPTNSSLFRPPAVAMRPCLCYTDVIHMHLLQKEELL